MTLNTTFQALRMNLANLAEWTQDQLTDLANAIATGWNIEHDGEGHHAAITATSAQVAGMTRAGRFSIGTILYPDVLTADVTTIWNPPGIATAGAIFVRGAFTIYGLSIEGRQAGDALAFINGNQSVDGFGLRQNASTLSGIAGSFRADGSVPDTDIVVPCGRWVWLIVSLNSPNAANAKLYWRVSAF